MDQRKSHAAQPDTEVQILTVPEAAKLLRVNRNTLYDAIKRGEVPGVQRVGRSIRICRVTVLRWFRGESLGAHHRRNSR